MKERMRLLVFAGTVAALACGVTATSQDVTGGQAEFGLASWYGYPFHGRTAANGQIYDMDLITAAHRTLPLESWVRVTNLVNSKTVDVRITDRGPFIDGRVIDLSRAAARAIDLIESGTAEVRLELISTPAEAALSSAQNFAGIGRFAVQVGAFRDKNNAERLRARMEQLHKLARVVARPGDAVIWRVLVGSEPSRSDAAALAEALAAAGATGFVVETDEHTTLAMATVE